jgi:hypothetical protein
MFDFFRLAEFGMSLWPKEWSNVEAKFSIPELNLSFTCDDKDFGHFRVKIFQNDHLVAYLEGDNKETTKPDIGLNLPAYPEKLLFTFFHMSRCRREFERTSQIEYSKGFGYFHARAVDEWNAWQAAPPRP